MKSTTAFLALALSVPAFAQINYEDLNNRTAETRETERSTKFSAALNAVGKYLDDALLPDVRVRLAAPKRSLNETEKEQAKLLKCLRTLLTKVKGGYDAPLVASNVIGTSLPTDEVAIAEAVGRCEEANENLIGLRSFDKLKMIKSIEAIDAAPKIKSLIASFIMPEEKCIVRHLTVQTSWIIGAGAGIGSIQCLSTNGAVKNFVGPVLRGNVGIGAMVSFSNRNANTVKFSKGKVIRFASSSDENDDGETNTAFVIGTDHGYGEPSSNLNIGVGGTIGVNGQAGIRVFDGASRWDIVLDSLK